VKATNTSPKPSKGDFAQQYSYTSLFSNTNSVDYDFIVVDEIEE
jgi:hypothetical protein